MSQPEETLNGQDWGNFNNKINHVTLDYNLEYEINMYE